MTNKILILTPDYPDSTCKYLGGIFIKDYVDTIKQSFQEIVVVAPVLRSGKILPNDRLCMDYSYDNVSVYYPRCLFIPRSISIPFISYKEKLSFDNRYPVVDHLLKNIGYRFDLIHAHFTWPSAYIGVMLKEKWNVPVVTTVHEDPAWLSEEINMNHPLIHKAWSNSDAILRPNSSDISLLKEYNKKVFHTANGYSPIFHPLDSKKCREDLGLPEDKRIILSVGNLEGIKGHIYLIAAIKRLISEYPDLLCIIIGDGSQRRFLIQQIKKESLSEYIRMIDYQIHDMIPTWMNACDLFVLPSLFESFGIVQIEAMACGKPVIASNTHGSREVIISDQYGLLCESGNVNDLAEKISLGLKREWNSEEIQQYVQKFSWDKKAKEVLDIYDDVLYGFKRIG